MVKNVRITVLVENMARGRHLLGEHGAGLVETGRAKGLDAQPERTR